MIPTHKHAAEKDETSEPHDETAPQKIQERLDGGWAGTKVRQSSRVRQMLQNGYLPAKIAFDIAENESSTFCGNIWQNFINEFCRKKKKRSANFAII